MKGKILIGTFFIVITLLVGGCNPTGSTPTTETPHKPVPPAPNKYLVSMSGEDFNKEAHIVRQVEVKTGDVFTIALDSNATTGFSWTEQSQIADESILKQTGHEYIAPRVNDNTKPVAGMSGIEEWWFTAGRAGTTTVTMSYGRPWEGGEKDARIFVLTVVVK